MIRLKKLIGVIHLWLGMISGILVFIIAITGCIYAFQYEIQELTQSYRFVNEQEKPFLLPSQLIEIAEKTLPDKHVHAVMYEGRERAAKAIFFSFEEHYYDFVYINPYTGEVLKVKDEYQDFFRIILDGHFYLWLPPDIGQPLSAGATLVFLIMVISGLILWWPASKKGVKQRFTIKWNVRWRRKNYDLHNVLGFYVSWMAILFAITGLVWGFTWFRDGVYKIVSGGGTFYEYQDPPSRNIVKENLQEEEMEAIDLVWYKMVKEYPEAGWIEIHPAETAESSIAANANPDVKTYWKTDYRYFDRYTLEELEVNHIWGKVDQASSADMLFRMNYDIHVGGILGLPGKLLAFFGSLIVASMPITGFLIWWGRRNKPRYNSRNIHTTRRDREARNVGL